MMAPKTFDLRATPEELAVCRLAPTAPIPEWLETGSFASATRTPAELSIVCERRAVPEGVRCEPGWRALEVEGPLDFSMVGVLSELTGALAAAELSVFVLSTFDTDFILVRDHQLSAAVSALDASGHRVRPA